MIWNWTKSGFQTSPAPNTGAAFSREENFPKNQESREPQNRETRDVPFNTFPFSLPRGLVRETNLSPHRATPWLMFPAIQWYPIWNDNARVARRDVRRRARWKLASVYTACRSPCVIMKSRRRLGAKSIYRYTNTPGNKCDFRYQHQCHFRPAPSGAINIRHRSAEEQEFHR